MAQLLTVRDLAAWVREDVDPADPWARIVIDAASELVCTTARQPLWTIQTAPARARQIAAHVAARSYRNPESVEVEGSIGPLGGDRLAEDFARALHLTDAEREELEAMAPGGGRGGLWVQPVVGSPAAVAGDIYLPDDSGSDWMVPYLDPDDFPALG